MHSSRIPKPSSTATATSICVTASGVSQSESVDGQRQQGSFVGLSTTTHTPKVTEYQQLTISKTNHGFYLIQCL